MMQNKNTIDASIRFLSSYSFLQESDELSQIKDDANKPQLTTFLMTYIQLNEAEKLQIMKTISTLFVENLKVVHKTIMTSDYDNYTDKRAYRQVKEAAKQ